MIETPSGDVVELAVVAIESFEQVSVEILQRVSEFKGVDVLDLSPPIHEVVDPHTLDNLFSNAFDEDVNQSISLCFSEWGTSIQVKATGELLLADREGCITDLEDYISEVSAN